MSTPPSSGVSFYYYDLPDESPTLEDIELYLFESRFNAENWNSAAAAPTARDVSAVRLSLFKNRFEIVPSATTTVGDWLSAIRDGADRHSIEVIRNTRGSPDYDKLKQRLRNVSWSGTYPLGRKGQTPAEPSGLLVLEIDHHDGPPPLGWLEAEKARLGTNPAVVAAYVSPGGAGVHVVVAIDPIPGDRDQHKQAWSWATRELALEAFGDPRVKDQTRLAAMSPRPRRLREHQSNSVDLETQHLGLRRGRVCAGAHPRRHCRGFQDGSPALRRGVVGHQRRRLPGGVEYALPLPSGRQPNELAYSAWRTDRH